MPTLLVYAAVTVLSVLLLIVALPRLATSTEPTPPLGRPPLPTPTEVIESAVIAQPTPLPIITPQSTTGSPAVIPSETAAPGPMPTASVAGGPIPAGVAGSPTATVVPQLLPIGQTTPWHLVFQDEFAGTSLNRTTWTTCYPWFDPENGCTNVGNDEIQWYMPQAAQVADGALNLTARPQQHIGTDGKTYSYVSGMISSGTGRPSLGPGFSFQYGYIEARLKIPAGRGIFPAFWLAPADFSWPPEIDIAERVGGTNPNSLEMIVHYARPDGSRAVNSTLFTGPNFAEEWHVFGLRWTRTEVVWYIDGVERKRFDRAESIPSLPMHIMISMAVRGDPAPDQSVRFPVSLSVDYVRVWQQ